MKKLSLFCMGISFFLLAQSCNINQSPADEGDENVNMDSVIQELKDDTIDTNNLEKPLIEDTTKKSKIKTHEKK